MARTLEEEEYIWAVSQISPDDGTNNFVAFFTKMDRAEKLAAKLRPASTVVQTTLWRDGDRYYRVTMHEVIVDAPTRQEVLAKLNEKERLVLGL